MSETTRAAAEVAVEVADNPGARRYEIRAGGRVVGFAAYTPLPQAVMFTHTEIDPAEEGHGYGSRLARAALDDVRRQGKGVIPMCPFIAAYIRKHPEYLGLVPEDTRKALNI